MANTAEVASRVNHIKTLVDLPVAVGFGIRDAESAAAVSASADAVIVGSVLVAMIGEHGSDSAALHSAVGGAVRSMRDAMDASADA